MADPVANPKFADKLAFLNAVVNWDAGLKPKAKRILVGDLNIAPLEHDVFGFLSVQCAGDVNLLCCSLHPAP